MEGTGPAGGGGTLQWQSLSSPDPSLGPAKSPKWKTPCSSTRPTRISSTSCHPRSGWRSRRRSAWPSERPRRLPSSPKRVVHASCPGDRGGREPRPWVQLAGAQQASQQPLASIPPLTAPAGLCAGRQPPCRLLCHNPGFLWGERAWGRGLSFRAPPPPEAGGGHQVSPGSSCSPAPAKASRAPPLLPVGPGTKGKVLSLWTQGEWLP